MKTVLIMTIGLLPILACAPTVAPQAAAGDIAAPQSEADMQVLRDRTAEYAAIFEQAQRAGLVSGAVRGALLGALVEGEAGMIIGAVFGAALGSALGGVAAERLVAEHQEFLNRQEIIANILAASRAATARSGEDAMIVRQAVAAQGAAAHPVPDAERAEIAASISVLRRAVELRSLLITELLQEAEIPPAERRAVQAELDQQRAALQDIRAAEDLWSNRDEV